MDVVASFPADPQAAEAVQSGDRPLDDPPEGAQAGAMRLATLADHRPDAALPHESTVVVVVAAVGEEHVGPPTRPADHAGNGGDLVQERKELGDVVAIAAGQRRRERDALAVGDDVVFAARACAVDRAGSACGPRRAGRTGRSRSPPATSRADSSSAASSAAVGAAGPTRPLRSRLPAGASTSCPSRSRAPAAGTPTEPIPTSDDSRSALCHGHLVDPGYDVLGGGRG